MAKSMKGLSQRDQLSNQNALQMINQGQAGGQNIIQMPSQYLQEQQNETFYSQNQLGSNYYAVMGNQNDELQNSFKNLAENSQNEGFIQNLIESKGLRKSQNQGLEVGMPLHALEI